MEYELANLLRRMVVGRVLTAEAGCVTLRQLLALSIHRVPPTPDLHERALLWAARLGQSKAYDAHYLALAEQLGIEILDGRPAPRERRSPGGGDLDSRGGRIEPEDGRLQRRRRPALTADGASDTLSMI